MPRNPIGERNGKCNAIQVPGNQEQGRAPDYRLRRAHVGDRADTAGLRREDRRGGHQEAIRGGHAQGVEPPLVRDVRRTAKIRVLHGACLVGHAHREQPGPGHGLDTAASQRTYGRAGHRLRSPLPDAQPGTGPDPRSRGKAGREQGSERLPCRDLRRLRQPDDHRGGHPHAHAGSRHRRVGVRCQRAWDEGGDDRGSVSDGPCPRPRTPHPTWPT